MKLDPELTKDDIARAAGLSGGSRLYHFETGRNPVPAAVVAALCDIYVCSTDIILSLYRIDSFDE